MEIDTSSVPAGSKVESSKQSLDTPLKSPANDDWQKMKQTQSSGN
jgi:DNA polymerase alpha subunit A